MFGHKNGKIKDEINQIRNQAIGIKASMDSFIKHNAAPTTQQLRRLSEMQYSLIERLNNLSALVSQVRDLI